MRRAALQHSLQSTITILLGIQCNVRSTTTLRRTVNNYIIATVCSATVGKATYRNTTSITMTIVIQILLFFIDTVGLRLFYSKMAGSYALNTA